MDKERITQLRGIYLSIRREIYDDASKVLTDVRMFWPYFSIPAKMAYARLSGEWESIAAPYPLTVRFIREAMANFPDVTLEELEEVAE